MSSEDDLERVAQVIERLGWWQGCHFKDKVYNSPCCLAGAADYLAHTKIPEDWYRSTREYHRIRRVLENHLGGIDPVVWNDAPGRTVEEVLEMLRGA